MSIIFPKHRCTPSRNSSEKALSPANPTSRIRGSEPATSLVLFTAAIVLTGAVLILRASQVPVSYNEAVTLLELSGQPSFPWPDVPFSAALFQGALQQERGARAVVEAVLHSDTHPPLYYLFAWGWRSLAGPAPESIRRFSILCFLFSSMVMFSALRNAAPGARLSACLIYLFVLAGGSDVLSCRNYALALLLISLHDRSLLRSRSAYLAGIFGGLAFLTHYLSIIAVLPSALASLTVSRIGKGKYIAYCAGYFLAGVGGLFCLLLQRHSRSGQFAGFPGLLSESLAGIQAISALLLPWPDDAAAARPLSMFFLLLGILLAARRFIPARGEPLPDSARFLANRSLFIIGCYFCGMLALDLLFHKSIISEGSPRYWIFLAAPLAVLFSLLVADCSKTQWIRVASLAALVALFSLHFAAGVKTSGRSPVPEMQNSFREACAKNELLVIGAGFGRGVPGAVALNAARAGFETPIAVLSRRNILPLTAAAASLHKICLITSGEAPTKDAEAGFLSANAEKISRFSFWSVFGAL